MQFFYLMVTYNCVLTYLGPAFLSLVCFMSFLDPNHNLQHLHVETECTRWLIDPNGGAANFKNADRQDCYICVLVYYWYIGVFNRHSCYQKRLTKTVPIFMQ